MVTGENEQCGPRHVYREDMRCALFFRVLPDPVPLRLATFTLYELFSIIGNR
jgi:hypothetical protein